jgi:FlaA1/EpsC-like NDP-sugar epimerase
VEGFAMGSAGEIYSFDMVKPVKIIDLAREKIKLEGFALDKDIKMQIVGLRSWGDYRKNFLSILQKDRLHSIIKL